MNIMLMKKSLPLSQFFKTLLFLAVFLVIFSLFRYIVNFATIKYLGKNTKEQIEISFQQAISDEFDCYILGASQFYRGINPEYLSVKSYNFSHDNDNYNQLYYKLLYLKDNNVDYKYLILDTEYCKFNFISDTRNYVYLELFDEEYARDYQNKGFYTKIEEYCSTEIRKLRELSPLVIRLLKNSDANTIPYLKTNGQYIKPGTATPNDTITRKGGYLDIQVDYFNRIVEFCKINDIELFLISMPRRDAELKNYTDEYIEDFKFRITSMLDVYAENYLDFTNLEGFKDYKLYVDICHFNETGANLFSEFLNEYLIENNFFDKSN